MSYEDKDKTVFRIGKFTYAIRLNKKLCLKNGIEEGDVLDLVVTKKKK